MPLLVAKKKDAKKIGVFEVAWTWLPYFLAADMTLHQEVDRRMKEKFKDMRFFEGDKHAYKDMSSAVVDIISELRPIPGLREALLAIEAMTPEDRPSLELVEEGSS